MFEKVKAFFKRTNEKVKELAGTVKKAAKATYSFIKSTIDQLLYKEAIPESKEKVQELMALDWQESRLGAFKKAIGCLAKLSWIWLRVGAFYVVFIVSFIPLTILALIKPDSGVATGVYNPA